MNAAIVLHGLFLLWCHQDKTCDIVAPHTMMNGSDVHNYKWGVLNATGALQLASIPSQDPSTIGKATMQLGTSELTAGPTNPFHASAPNPYRNYEFTLDPSKLTVNLNATAVRNVIHIPWPDQVIGANRTLVASNIVAPTAALAAGVISPAVGGL